MASRPFQFREKKHFKIGKSAAKHFEGLAALSIHSAERRAAVKAGCKPVHFSLDGCPLSCYFSESVATTSGHFVHKSERRTKNGAFIYALSAVENRPALAAPRHTSTALFSCRFKCPCPPRRQRHLHGNADRAYNTLHFASQSRVPNGGVAPFGNPLLPSGDGLPADMQLLSQLLLGDISFFSYCAKIFSKAHRVPPFMCDMLSDPAASMCGGPSWYACIIAEMP